MQDGVWHTLSSYLIKVDEVRDTRHYVENASMAIFDFTGKEAEYELEKFLVLKESDIYAVVEK